MANINTTSLRESIEILRQALETDAGYHYSWKANIAMAFFDAVHQNPHLTTHEQANIAAQQFLDNLCHRG